MSDSCCTGQKRYNVSKDTILLTLTCNSPDCMLRARVGRVLSKPAMQVGGFKFCPQCGGPANAGQDNDEDYWEVLGQSYNLPPDLMKMLYDTWDTRAYTKFTDYVADIREEVDNESGDKHSP